MADHQFSSRFNDASAYIQTHNPTTSLRLRHRKPSTLLSKSLLFCLLTSPTWVAHHISVQTFSSNLMFEKAPANVRTGESRRLSKMEGLGYRPLRRQQLIIVVRRKIKYVRVFLTLVILSNGRLLKVSYLPPPSCLISAHLCTRWNSPTSDQPPLKSLPTKNSITHGTNSFRALFGTDNCT